MVASQICDETNLSNIADFRVSGESFWIHDSMWKVYNILKYIYLMEIYRIWD